MAFSKIILKKGIGSPGTTLYEAEPAIDLAGEVLYVGKGIGSAPIAIYGGGYIRNNYVPIFSYDLSIGISAVQNNTSYVDIWVNPDFGNSTYGLEVLTDRAALYYINGGYVNSFSLEASASCAIKPICYTADISTFDLPNPLIHLEYADRRYVKDASLDVIRGGYY